VHKVLKFTKKCGSYGPEYRGTFLWPTVYVHVQFTYHFISELLFILVRKNLKLKCDSL